MAFISIAYVSMCGFLPVEFVLCSVVRVLDIACCGPEGAVRLGVDFVSLTATDFWFAGHCIKFGANMATCTV